MATRFRDFRFSVRAEADLEGIYEYTRKAWSVTQAERYTHELEAAVQSLVDGVKVGRSREDLDAGLFSLTVGSHHVIYADFDGILLVVRILHGAMDQARHFNR